MGRRVRIAVGIALLALACGGGGVARAGPSLDAAGVQAAEEKALAALLKMALKEDLRRQAWYLSTRLVHLDAKDEDAAAVLKKWTPLELAQGVVPSKQFKEKRDAALKQVGDAYAQLVRDLQAKGGAAAETSGFVERALAYGSKAADATQALEAAGQAWCGTWGALPKADVQAALGSLGDAITFPPEFDDAYLKSRVSWPDARTVRLRDWRIVVAGPIAEAGRTATLVSAVETHFVRTLGSVAKDAPDRDKEDDTAWDFVVVPDVATYDALAPLLFHSEDPKRQARVAGTSGWSDAWRRQTLVLEKYRDNAWVAPEAQVAGWATRTLVRRHLGPGGYGVSGRGAWLLDGIQGAYEGFRAKGPDGGEIDFDRCWRLAVARALKEKSALLPWPRFLELDAQAGQDEAKTDLTLRFDGADREAKSVSVVSAQATAYVVGLWRKDGDKGPKKLSLLVQETVKRNRLPDVDKACGWRPGTALEAAQQALEPAPPK